MRLSNYNNWRQSVMTLKQKIAGAELYFSRAYSSFWWLQENSWRSYNCHSKNYHVGLFRNAKGSKETWVLPHTNQTQYQKWMSRKLFFFKYYFICTLSKHIASIDFSKRPLEHAFAPHFASNYCRCWAPYGWIGFYIEPIIDDELEVTVAVRAILLVMVFEWNGV